MYYIPLVILNRWCVSVIETIVDLVKGCPYSQSTSLCIVIQGHTVSLYTCHQVYIIEEEKEYQTRVFSGIAVYVAAPYLSPFFRSLLPTYHFSISHSLPICVHLCCLRALYPFALLSLFSFYYSYCLSYPTLVHASPSLPFCLPLLLASLSVIIEGEAQSSS